MFTVTTMMTRVFLNYIVIFMTFRFMGKREVGELSLVDLIVFLMIAEIAALSIESVEKPYYLTLLAIGTLVILQKGLAYLLLKKAKLRNKVEGTASVIIANGTVDYFEMRKNRYTFDDLMVQLRQKGFKSISEVEFAILESNGTLSTFRKELDQPFMSPLPLVLSGEIISRNFKYIDIDELDFMTLLINKGYTDTKSIMYANYENNELFIVTTSVD